MYLMIENDGVSSADCWVKMGLSSTRQNDDPRLIGKFGSGVKHGIMTLLRNKISPIIYLGENQLSVSTEKKSAKTLDGEMDYQEIIFSIDGQSFPSGFTAGFGELDWQDTNMAIREFVSNAIDASYKMTDSPIEGCRIDYVTEIATSPTKTRIFIPVHNPFERDKYFLHFLHPGFNWSKSAVIEKSSLSPAKIYRRGVLVFEDSTPSLFDYNFADIRLDESRNLDKSSIYTNIKQEFTFDLPRKHKGKILQAIVKDETPEGEILETKVYWGGGFLGTDETGLSIWNEFVGKDKVAVISITASQNTIDAIRHKGKIPVRIINHNGSAMRFWGVPKEADFITVEAEITKRVINPTVTHQKIFNNVWASIELSGMARKAVPKFFFFESTDKGVLGYCQDGAVYVNLDLSHNHKELAKTILEEITHYITNEGDFSRGFQEFLLELVYNVVLK